MPKNTGDSGASASPETILTHSGRHSENHLGFVNTPVFRGSTILFKDLDALEDYNAPYRYGRNDNPTSRGLSELVSELEGAAGTIIGPSGLAGVTTPLLAVLSAGDELLVTDTAYDPTRHFARDALSRWGISTRFYDPRIGAGIASQITEKTRAIFVESPGSLTFEMQDLPAIAAVAKPRGIAVLVDNSWATPLFHKPLELGADIVIHAGTKMLVGHSDALLGTASANAEYWPKLQQTQRLLGVSVSPDDAFLALRGMRTLGIRMKEQQARAVEIAAWLEQQPGVLQVYHPALPSHPDHAIWKRDFTGSGSLFAVRLKAASRPAIAALVNGLTLFGMGYSWGGYESLFLPIKPERSRTAVPWTAEGSMFRVHIGLEDPADLKAELAAGLARYLAV